MTGYGLDEAAADLVLILIVGVNCYVGWRFGLVRRAIAVVAVFAGALAATYIGNPVATLVRPDDLYANAWCFVGIFAIVLVMIEILAALYGEQLKGMVTLVFDRVTGLLAGAAVGLLEAGVLFLVAQAVADVPATAAIPVPSGHQQVAVAVDHGLLTQLVVRIEPGIQALLGPALPGSLSGRFAEPTAAVTGSPAP